jgi:hypothetical protein
MYFTEWPGDDRTFLPCATRHAYTNKVLAAKQSVFHFQPIDKGDKEAYGLFDRPKLTDYIAMQYLQGDASPAGQRANEALTRWNAKLGRAKQVSMRVLVFSGQPIQAALKQEAYWQRGTKNEFTVCVGVDRTGSVQWAHVLSWTDVERLKIDVRDFARSMGRWEPERLVEYMASKVRAEFVRKPFAEFDYLQIETPQWGRILAVVLAVIVTGGLDWFALSNEWSEEDSVVEAVGEFVRAMR